MQEIHASHVLLKNMFPWPVGVWLSDCRAIGDPKTMGGGTTADYPVMVARIPYWRRTGEAVTTLAYSILGETDAAGAGGKARIKVRSGQNTDPMDDTGALALHTAAVDPEDSADWLDGTLDISAGVVGDPNVPIWIEVYVYSNTSGDGSGIYSVCIQEEPY